MDLPKPKKRYKIQISEEEIPINNHKKLFTFNKSKEEITFQAIYAEDQIDIDAVKRQCTKGKLLIEEI